MKPTKEDAPAAPDVDGLVQALGQQRQIDEDGTECGVSRQAVDEARALLVEWRALIERLSAKGREDAGEIARLRSVLEWANRKGGMGLDVHARFEAAIAARGEG